MFTLINPYCFLLKGKIHIKYPDVLNLINYSRRYIKRSPTAVLGAVKLHVAKHIATRCIRR